MKPSPILPVGLQEASNYQGQTSQIQAPFPPSDVGENCQAWKSVKIVLSAVKATSSNAIVAIKKPDKKCPKQYIGETDRTLQARFCEHKGYKVNQRLLKLLATILTCQATHFQTWK